MFNQCAAVKQRPLGKGEVESSILSCSTIFQRHMRMKWPDWAIDAASKLTKIMSLTKS